MIDDPYLKASPNYFDIVSKRSSLVVKKKLTDNAKPILEIQIRRVYFIVEKLIPMLYGLKFITKKHKDFLD